MLRSPLAEGGCAQQAAPAADNRGMKQFVALVVMAIVVAACGESVVSADFEVTATTQAAAPSSTAVTTTVASSARSLALSEADIVTYIATVEDALAGTAYEGEALAFPEVFVATGVLFCNQLEAGQSPDLVLTQYIESLTGASVDAAPLDDLDMAGGVLGAGVVTLCPNHMTLLTGSG